MEEFAPHIVRLEPMRVASALAYSQSPERQAHEKLLGWAKVKGLLEAGQSHRFFGFNNPGPSAGSPNYGYEFWMTVGPDEQPEGEVSIKDFAGGLYAVVRCQGAANIMSAWEQLVSWLETSPYTLGNHQWLEEHLAFQDVPDDQLLLDLYMPVV